MSRWLWSQWSNRRITKTFNASNFAGVPIASYTPRLRKTLESARNLEADQSGVSNHRLAVFKNGSINGTKLSSTPRAGVNDANTRGWRYPRLLPRPDNTRGVCETSTPDDHIITLGDHIHRGPDTRSVIQWLIDRQEEGTLDRVTLQPRVCLSGGHHIRIGS